MSRHLRILRESGFTSVRSRGMRRIYALDVAALDDVEGWMTALRHEWSQRLDALGTELARGRRGHPNPSANTADRTPSTQEKAL